MVVIVVTFGSGNGNASGSGDSKEKLSSFKVFTSAYLFFSVNTFSSENSKETVNETASYARNVFCYSLT